MVSPLNPQKYPNFCKFPMVSMNACGMMGKYSKIFEEIKTGGGEPRNFGTSEPWNFRTLEL